MSIHNLPGLRPGPLIQRGLSRPGSHPVSRADYHWDFGINPLFLNPTPLQLTNLRTATENGTMFTVCPIIIKFGKYYNSIIMC